MGEKSIQKKTHILKCAREVFAKNGYLAVTMKDIVEACEISRGGLYLYYESVSQIFLEVLKLESEEADDIFGANISEDATACDILILFLKEQKKEIFKKKNTLTRAIYEFYFSNTPAKKDNVLKKQFDQAVRIISKLIETGVDNGEFVCDDPELSAKSIMYQIEGLKISAQTISVSADDIDKAILFILKNLGV